MNWFVFTMILTYSPSPTPPTLPPPPPMASHYTMFHKSHATEEACKTEGARHAKEVNEAQPSILKVGQRLAFGCVQG